MTFAAGWRALSQLELSLGNPGDGLTFPNVSSSPGQLGVPSLRPELAECRDHIPIPGLNQLHENGRPRPRNYAPRKFFFFSVREFTSGLRFF